MTGKAKEVEDTMVEMANPAQAAHLMRFFKCGKGEYGYGDKFLGLRCPTTRGIVKECRELISIDDATQLIKSQWHEVRLAGFLFLIELYKKALKRKDDKQARAIVDIYLDHIDYGNNWDLVDMVAPKILGDYILRHPELGSVLDQLSERADSLWHQRVAIVSTWMIIRGGRFEEALRIARKYLTHSHDLIHKATGWMLREIGKRGGSREHLDFLDAYAPIMPRTALRYAIEQLPEPLRQHYLRLPRRPAVTTPVDC